METTSLLNCARGKKILVVEDEELVRTVCAAILHQHGFDHILASNGADGFEIYKEKHDEICLVLSDILMPARSGLEMFRDILKIQPHANVILMSGGSRTEIIPDEFEKLCSIMKKPFTSSALMWSINKCLMYEEQKTSGAKG